MAYVLNYTIGFASQQKTGVINIYKDAYAGTVTALTMARDSLFIRYNFRGFEDPIIGLTAGFSIINTNENIFDLLPLLTAAEMEYFIEIIEYSHGTQLRFKGWLNCEDNEQTYLKNRNITLNASSYLSKLQYIEPSILDTLENRSFIDIILAILAETGSAANVRVNCHLIPNNDSLGTTKTALNLTGVYTESFYKNNIDKENGLDILKIILESFDAYIYQYAGYWYIERYTDIYKSPQNYVEYSSMSTYGPGDSGTAVQTTNSIFDFNDLTFIGQSQNIQINQGKKEIEINVEQKLLYNLTINDLTNATDVYGVVPYPNIRTWQKWNESGLDWFNMGQPYNNISNSIKRAGYINSGGPLYYRGIYTKFILTVTESTNLTIKFKYATIKGQFGTFTTWVDFTFNFNFYLRVHDPAKYVYYDNSASAWTLASKNELTGLNVISIDGSSFDDTNASAEVSISIPLGELVSELEGDRVFILGIGTEKVDKSGGGSTPSIIAWYGDVIISATGVLTENYFKGIINNKFLNKLSLSQYFNDVSDLNVKNGIFRGASLSERTDTWTNDGTEYLTLAETKIRDKFRLYNKSRQVLTAKISTNAFFKPFSMFIDSNQTGLKFILTNATYYLERQRVNISLNEYDNTETINIL